MPWLPRLPMRWVLNMWESLGAFWDEHGTTLMITLGAGLLFFVLGPLVAAFSRRRIRRERVGKVKDSLANLLEGMLVNQEEISGDKLHRMLRATEREADVILGSAYDLDRLIDDVSLRFQRSLHLDATQKNGYLKTLSDLADALAKSEEEVDRRTVPESYDRIMRDLTSSMESGDKVKASLYIARLKEKLSQGAFSDSDDLPFSLFSAYVRLMRRPPRLLDRPASLQMSQVQVLIVFPSPLRIFQPAALIMLDLHARRSEAEPR